MKAGAYIVSIDRKTAVYRLEAGEIVSFSFSYFLSSCPRNTFPYFTELPVSLYCLYSSRAGLQYDTVQACCCNNLNLAGKQPVQIKPLNSIFRNVLGSLSGSHTLLLCKNYSLNKTCMYRIVYTKLSDSLLSQCGINWICYLVKTKYSFSSSFSSCTCACTE